MIGAHQRMYQRITLSLLFFLMCAYAPGVVHAQTTSDALLAQIAQLLAQVQSLQSQLNTLGGTPTGGGSAVPGVGQIPTVAVHTALSGACVRLTQSLAPGAEGADVEALQRALAQDTALYPEGLITGYYGALTQRAVERFQAARGIVFGGTPATTGYGAVGPQTRNALLAGCSPAQRNPAIARDLVITPEVGPLPLSVTATFSLNGSSCSSYELDWGDGTRPLSFDAGSQGGACSRDIAHKRATHTYTLPGAHTAVLRATQGPLSEATVVSRTTISVGETQLRGFSLSPTTGSAPLTTSITFPVAGSNCTSYEADWGDGTIDRFEATQFSTCINDSGTESLTHTYTAPGTYTVRFKTGRARIAELETNEVWRVVVAGDITPTTAVEIQPTAGEAPLRVDVRMYGFGESCTSYSLDWGDGSALQQFEALEDLTCGSEPFEAVFSHTYITPGSYQLRIRTGQQPLAQLPVKAETITVGDARASGVQTRCPYSSAPVCGELEVQCSAGFSCRRSVQTFADRCILEDAGARFLYSGTCR